MAMCIYTVYAGLKANLRCFQLHHPHFLQASFFFNSWQSPEKMANTPPLVLGLCLGFWTWEAEVVGVIPGGWSTPKTLGQPREVEALDRSDPAGRPPEAAGSPPRGRFRQPGTGWSRRDRAPGRRGSPEKKTEKASFGSFCLCLIVAWFMCLFVCFCLFVCLIVCLFVCWFVGLSVCLSVCLLACLLVCLFVCLLGLLVWLVRWLVAWVGWEDGRVCGFICWLGVWRFGLAWFVCRVCGMCLYVCLLA